MINLLPWQYKKELKREENFRLILILGFMLFLFLIASILILLGINLYVKSGADSLKILVEAEKERQFFSEVRQLQEEIVESNKKIAELKLFYKRQVSSFLILESIFRALPPGVRLTSISWQKNTGQAVVSGFSPTTEILFSLRSNLEDEQRFSEVYFPLQNWIKPTNIDFQATFKID